MGNLEKLLKTAPLFLPALSLLSGILISVFSGIGLKSGFILILFSVIIYLILSYLKKNPISFYKIRNYHYAWLLISFIGLGIITYDLNNPFIDYRMDSITNCHVCGVVESITNTNIGDQLIIKVVKIEDGDNISIANRNLRIKVVAPLSKCNVGDLISLKTDLTEVRDSENSFRGGYAKYLKNQGILLEGEALTEISKINDNNFNIFKRLSFEIRDSFIRNIEYSHLNKKTQQFLITILLGDKDYIDPDMRTNFSGAGISHILALSGMHVGIIASILLCLLFPLCLLGKYKWRYGIIIIVLWGYCFVTGMQPSTLRAVIMCSFTLIGIIIERRNFGFNSLCAAFLLILVFSPMDLFDLGFQMSFICVFTIISFSKTLSILPHRKHPYIYKSINLMFITFVASFCTWVLTAYYFHIIPSAFFLSNLFILPQLPIFIFVSLIYLSLSVSGIHIDCLSSIIDKWFHLILDSIKYLSTNNVINIDIPGETLIFWFLGIILLSVYINHKANKLILCSCIVAFTFSIVFIAFFPPVYKDKDYIITNNYYGIKINVMDKGKETPYHMQRYCSSILRIGNHKIVIIDSNLNNFEVLNGAEIIILGAGFKGDINELTKYMDDSVMVIHSSIRRKKENEYISILKEKGKAHHSLRNDGPYKSYLSKKSLSQ